MLSFLKISLTKNQFCQQQQTFALFFITYVSFKDSIKQAAEYHFVPAIMMNPAKKSRLVLKLMLKKSIKPWPKSQIVSNLSRRYFFCNDCAQLCGKKLAFLLQLHRIQTSIFFFIGQDQSLQFSKDAKIARHHVFFCLFIFLIKLMNLINHQIIIY